MFLALSSIRDSDVDLNHLQSTKIRLGFMGLSFLDHGSSEKMLICT